MRRKVAERLRKPESGTVVGGVGPTSERRTGLRVGLDSFLAGWVSWLARWTWTLVA
jgi:hypothetical protein